MTRLYFFFLLLLMICCGETLRSQEDTSIVKPLLVDTAQRGDSVPPPVPAQITEDSVSQRPVVKDSGWRYDPSTPLMYQVLSRHPYFGFSSKPELPVNSDKKVFNGKELIFYVLIALLLLFALLRQAFPKYFTDLFRLFFRTTLKQRQIREQLMQTPLPSLLLNGFFFMCAGLYVGFLLQHFQFIPEGDFWLYSLYSCIGLSLIYLVKFLGLKVTGWVLEFLRRPIPIYL